MPRIGAKKRLQSLKRKRIGQVVDRSQLQKAAGEVAERVRRFRELRDEGWSVRSHNDQSDLKPGQYVLEGMAAQASLYPFSRPGPWLGSHPSLPDFTPMLPVGNSG